MEPACQTPVLCSEEEKEKKVTISRQGQAITVDASGCENYLEVVALLELGKYYFLSNLLDEEERGEA